MAARKEQTRQAARRPQLAVSGWLFAALAALCVTLLDNRTLFADLAARTDWRNVSDLWASFVVVYAFTTLSFLILLLFAPRRLQKLLTGIYLVLAAGVAFFTDRYGVIFNEDMIRNVADSVREANVAEATELVSMPFVAQVVLLGVLPAVALMLLNIRKQPALAELRSRVAAGAIALVLVAVLVAVSSQAVIGFAVKNRDLRHHVTPLHTIASTEKYFRHKRTRDGVPFHELGQDARIAMPRTRRTVGILIVGETERADHFSLNGYERRTNPLLENDAVISFVNAYSCGTATAVSVPCMFSMRGRSTFEVESIRHESNVLDLLSHAGVRVDWIDGNSGCKSVCDRVALETVSDETGFVDERLVDMMTDRLDDLDGDALLVLHILGSHGPAYDKRVPDEFRVFNPACSGNSPISCEQSQLINAYDNTIYYLDFLIHKVIVELQSRSSEVDSFVLFVSDHGESLGESGIYLHGLPYALAPEAQTHIPMIFWSSRTFAEHRGLRREALAEAAMNPVSHDNLAHALLGLYDVRTDLYERDLDPFAAAMQESPLRAGQP